MQAAKAGLEAELATQVQQHAAATEEAAATNTAAFEEAEAKNKAAFEEAEAKNKAAFEEAEAKAKSALEAALAQVAHWQGVAEETGGRLETFMKHAGVADTTQLETLHKISREAELLRSQLNGKDDLAARLTSTEEKLEEVERTRA